MLSLGEDLETLARTDAPMFFVALIPQPDRLSVPGWLPNPAGPATMVRIWRTCRPCPQLPTVSERCRQWLALLTSVVDRAVPHVQRHEGSDQVQGVRFSIALSCLDVGAQHLALR
jgi:hypothetical protein